MAVTSHFNLRHYAALAATVRHGSLTRAAKAVNLTQPALTQAIRRLEDDLGCALFERRPDGMIATEPGRILARRAEEVIGQIGSTRVTGTQFSAFLELARAGSYAMAAANMGLSSASLHRAVSGLSDALGQRLVERRGRGIMLTTVGQRLARRFGLAKAELRAGLAEVAQWKGEAEGQIAIGAMPLSRARWLPTAIARFGKDHPGVDIEIMEGSYAELSGPLRDGDIDMMLGALRAGSDAVDLEQEPVFEDRPAVIMRVGHPLLDKPGPLGANTLLDHPWILPGRSTPLRAYWEAMLLSLGLEPPHVAIECGSVLTIRELLLSSDALTLLSTDQLRVEIEGGLLGWRAPPVPVARTIGIITRAGWRPTATQAACLAELKGFSPG
ncbi:MAG: LysR substrate-binding domain-containing protein [Parasphingopyxis sp.]